MKTCTKCGVGKPLVEFYKDKTRRDGLTERCKPCKAVANKASYEANKDSQLAACKAWREANKERKAATTAAWSKANRDKCNAANKRYYKDNKANKAEYSRQWKQANKGKRNSYVLKRLAAKQKATPPWLTPQHHAQIQAFYIDAASRSTPHHVDHIIPLNGKTVCGLHVPWNLEVVSADLNLAKNNKCWPGAWDEDNQLKYMLL